MRLRNVAHTFLISGLMTAAAFAQAPDQAPPPPPEFSANTDQGPPPDFQGPPPRNQAPPQREAWAAPSRLTLKAGTWLPIRVEQPLSSDKNQTGESFYATLADPLVVNGIVVAHRGQTVIGRITQATKAGRVEGTSRLGLEITAITTADGEHVNVHSRIIEHNGTTSTGRDLAAVGQATAMGAAIGGISDGGRGAGIGAGIGAAAGLAGVLMTRGRPTVVYPESMLTFELSAPVEIDTAHAPGAFRYADSRDFEQDRSFAPRRAAVQQQPPPPPYYGGYGYPGPGWGPGWGYPGYGTGIGIMIGRGYGWRGGYRGRR